MIENAVVDGVSKATSIREDVPPQDTFFHRAQSKHCRPGLIVEHVGLELYPHAVPDVERMSEHQVLRFGVHIGSLKRRRDPRPADLHPAIHWIDVAEASAPHECRRRFVDRNERNCVSIRRATSDSG